MLDVPTEAPAWFDWSARTLEDQAAQAPLCSNPLIYAEVSVGFERIEELDEALPPADFTRLPLRWEAGFLAGKAFVRYPRDGGQHHSPLPDFLIGAHAAVARLPQLTRDVRRHRSHFPRLRLICPDPA
nr:type II toxin-antitoxin system VapC family toxin [Stenotrophomonas sp. MMGLT7]